MTRVLLVIGFNLLLFLPGLSQFGNEWIDFDQEYVVIKVANDGIYQITGNSLQSAGVDISTIDPSTLQLFYRGREVAVQVRDNSDGMFDQTDDVLFYGRRNDGKLDTELYSPGTQLHTYYSLFSDSSSYFLTWNGETGNRMTTYNLPISGSPPQVTSRQYTVRVVNTSRYARGDNLEYNSYYSGFDQGEGFTSTRVQEGNNLDFVLPGVSNGVVADGVPQLTLQLLGERVEDHFAEIWVGPDAGSFRQVGSAGFTAYNTFLFSSSLAWSDIGPTGDLHVQIRVVGVAGGNDLISCPYLQVTYPKDLDYQGIADRTDLTASAETQKLLDVTNPPINPILLDITDPDQPVEIGFELNGGVLQSVVDNTNSDRNLYLAGVPLPTEPGQVNFRAIDPADNEFIILTHRSLRVPAGGYQDPVLEYATYRRSLAGGDYDTLIVEIDDVFGQFGYGDPSPLAIYRFVDYMSQQDTPDNLFIVGKALSVRFNFLRDPGGFSYANLIPTAGFPGSDIAYAIGLNSTDHIPAFPVGRIPAVTASDVSNYFDKIKEMESSPYNALWRKDLLHLSGGITSFEQNQFFSYMERFRGYAEDIYLGGNVRTIKKNSVENVTFINISEQINNGQDMVCFYGHSNPNITDIDIGKVSDPVNGYNNKGKYPLFLINGCEAGRIFENAQIWGEDWILAKEKGAVQFIAHSSYGLASHLQIYSNLFYENRFSLEDQINASIGVIHKNTSKTYAETYDMNSYWHRAMVYQMVLMGDPAYAPFSAGKPDFSVSETGVDVVSKTGNPVTAQTQVFYLDIRVDNLGKADRDSVLVKVERYLDEGTMLSYDSLFPPVLYSDTLRFEIVNETSIDFSGMNRFVITVDADFKYDEINELNNTVNFDYFMPLNGTKNLFPQDFSIQPSGDIEFVFQSTDPLTLSENYLLEIDTAYLFDSPFLKQESVTGPMLVKRSTILLDNQIQNDSTTYYWRTRIESPEPGQSDDWSTSSFSVFYNSPTGWSQTYFPQHLGNSSINLIADSTERTWKFSESSLHLNITTYGDAHPAKNTDVSVRLNDLEYIINNSRPCRDQTINMIAFDRQTALPYAPIPLAFQDTRTCGRQPQVINSFSIQQFENGGNDLLRAIDQIKPGDTVVVFTIGNIRYSLWSANVKNKFSDLGIDPTVFDNVDDKEPLVILGAKNSAVGSATVFFGETIPEIESEINLDTYITGRAEEGSLTSQLIGPALDWTEMSHQLISLESPSSDSFQFDIVGLDAGFNETVLISESFNGPRDLSGIDPMAFPYLRVVNRLNDEVDLTPPQPKRWTILYSLPPEGVLWSDIGAEPIIVQEGEEVQLGFSFNNISEIAFPDSLTVEYEIINKALGKIDRYSLNILQPDPGDTTTFGISISTLGREGTNDLSITVNPAIFAEQYYDNNTLSVTGLLKVQPDKISPQIEATIDGRFILDGEIVSATPDIDIRLSDENKFRLLNDTTLMDVYIKKPCTGCDFERIAYSGAEASYDAPDPEQRLYLNYRPQALEDGVYVLKVEAKDASGNGFTDPYQISFEVVNESSISNFYPYPNPFSDRMHFVFTLTGNQLPDEIKIRIMTVTGRVIREISQEELGGLHIGHNKSDFTWDGTDQFGDRLANGVYLYQVLARVNGKEIKLRSTAGDAAFKNGVGKIYLLR